MKLETPLAKARGLGSAKDGTHHWWMQRVTAIAMIPLVVWFVYSLAGLSLASQADITEWMSHPFQALLLVVFLGTGCYHGKLGMQVVIEDYVHCTCYRTTLLLINALGFWLLGAMAVLAIGKLHFTGAMPIV